MHDALLWIYFANAVLLILHEIDSAYWKEWELFRIPGGIAVFLLFHVPLLSAILYGLVLLARHEPAGLYFSLALGIGGAFAFALHSYFIARGRPEFRTPASITVLASTLIVSAAQLAATIKLLRAGGSWS